MCPVELKFDVSIERAKDSLRKADQRHNEGLEDQRQQISQPQTFLLLFLLKFICLSSKRYVGSKLQISNFEPTYLQK